VLREKTKTHLYRRPRREIFMNLFKFGLKSIALIVFDPLALSTSPSKVSFRKRRDPGNETSAVFPRSHVKFQKIGKCFIKTKTCTWFWLFSVVLFFERSWSQNMHGKFSPESNLVLTNLALFYWKETRKCEDPIETYWAVLPLIMLYDCVHHHNVVSK